MIFFAACAVLAVLLLSLGILMTVKRQQELESTFHFLHYSCNLNRYNQMELVLHLKGPEATTEEQFALAVMKRDLIAQARSLGIDLKFDAVQPPPAKD